MTKLLIGADPELMLSDGHGNLKSAIGVVTGTKKDKIDLGGGHLLFYDNVLAEVNLRPAASADALVNNVRDCLYRLNRAIHPMRLVLQESATYPPSECQHPDALVFGCEPEFDAYDLCMLQPPECTTTFRSAGGHIHLGYDAEEYPLMAPLNDGDRSERDWGRLWVIRMMDLFWGIPSLWMDHDPTGVARRKLYGGAGTHRQKEEYGVEYRASGNFWLRSPQTVRLVYDVCQFVVDFVGRGGHMNLWADKERCSAYDVAALRQSINESDVKRAQAILNGPVKTHMPADLFGQLLLACETQAGPFQRAWGF